MYQATDVVLGARYVCSEIGTKGSAAAIKQLFIAGAEIQGYPDVESAGDGVCKKGGHKGFVRAEIVGGKGASFGALLQRSDQVSSAARYMFMCSMFHETASFVNAFVAGEKALTSSCHDVCEAQRSLTGTALRAYFSEPMCKPMPEIEAREVNGIGFDSYFSLRRLLTKSIGNKALGDSKLNSLCDLHCVCGPGQDMGAVMSYRAAKTMWGWMR
jgi:hypothetical protein